MLEKPQKKEDGADSRENLVKAQGCTDKLADTVTDTDNKITQIHEAKKKASASGGGLGGGTLMFSNQAKGINSEQNFEKIQGQLKEAEAQIKQLQNNIALTLGQTERLSVGLGGSSKGRQESDADDKE